MSIITALIPILVLLDLVWWGLGGSLAAQGGLPGPDSDSAQPLLRLSAGLLAGVIASRQAELWGQLPTFVTTAVYLWHLLIMPLLLPLWAIGGGRCAPLLGHR